MEEITSTQIPLDKNGQLGLRRKRRRCGYCGFNVTINNKGGGMRVHGPKDNRCIGSGVKWTPVFHRSARNGGVIKRWGTCGICGDVTEFPDGAGHTKDHDEMSSKYLHRHDHERPRITKDRVTGEWRVFVTSHRNGKSILVKGESYEDACEKAALIDMMKR